MLQVGSYVFKQAETEEEFEQIHHLNYRTFVKEIRQHGDTGSAKLVDKFHHKNLYFIVLKSGRLVGMLSAHDQPPFSVAERLHDPLLLQGPNMQPLEVRLLAIEPAERNSSLFFGLIWTLYDYALRTQKSHLIISGVTDRMRLYERLGFAAIGPAVPSGNATFVPMMLTVGQLPGKIQRIKNLWENHLEQVFTCANQTGRSGRSSGKSAGEARRRPPSPVQRALSEADVCLLPGPVTVSQEVRDAFTEPPRPRVHPAFQSYSLDSW